MKRLLINLILGAVVLAAGVSLWLARNPGPQLPENLVAAEARGGVRAVTDLSALPTVHLRILNATEVSGLAGELALLVPGLGQCVVEGVGNAPRQAGSNSVLINRRLDEGQARALATALGGLPVIPEWDDRTTEDAVLILGRDHERVRRALQKAREEKAP